MSEFNISTFISAMQIGLAEDNKQEVAGRLLLEAVAKQDCARVDVDAKMVSNLMKRKADVHEAIKTASARREVIAEAKRYFEDEVMIKLNPHTYGDSCLKIERLLENDSSVPESKRDELNILYKDGKTVDFLVAAFLYAVSRPNKLEGGAVEYSDMPLLSEVNNECPLCHSPLVKTIKGKPIKKYIIVKIYPDDLDDKKVAEFEAALKPPTRLDSNDNKIALCEDCAAEYLLDSSVDEYVQLFGIKKQAVKSYAMRQEIAKLNLEEEIKEVIEKLAGLNNTSGLLQLPLSALKIKNKILEDNGVLRHTLTDNVLTYYRFIEDTFSNMDSGTATDFDLIASEIHVTYEMLERENLSQDEIVNRLAEWIQTSTHMASKYYLACHIVVAFFVQNCEVFHEVSK
ncbi:MAG: hypothetical protein RR415_11800 [Ruthenibacterium sp.]